MKGKIYKNKLSTSFNNTDQPNNNNHNLSSNNKHLDTTLSNINVKITQQYSPQFIIILTTTSNDSFKQFSFLKNPTTSTSKLQTNFNSPSKNIPKFIQDQKQQQRAQRSLKRVISNPILIKFHDNHNDNDNNNKNIFNKQTTSYQYLLQSTNRQNNKKDRLLSFLSSHDYVNNVNINVDEQSMRSYYNKYIDGNVNSNLYKNEQTQKSIIHGVSRLNSNRIQCQHSILNKINILNSPSQPPYSYNLPSTSLKPSYLPHTTSSYPTLLPTQYISSLQSRHQQRFSSLSMLHQTQISHLTQQLNNKDNIIEQLKLLLKQKIKLLKNQNKKIQNQQPDP